MTAPKLVGLVFGLTMGVVLVWLGVWQAVVVGVFGLTGYLAGKYASDELPIVDRLLERFLEFRRRRR